MIVVYGLLTDIHVSSLGYYVIAAYNFSYVMKPAHAQPAQSMHMKLLSTLHVFWTGRFNDSITDYLLHVGGIQN